MPHKQRGGRKPKHKNDYGTEAGTEDVSGDTFSVAGVEFDCGCGELAALFAGAED